MRSKMWKLMCGAGVAAVVWAMVPSAGAECGFPNQPIKTMSWQIPFQGNPALVRTGLDVDDGPQIDGMWHVIFKEKTQNGVKIPVSGGVVIDNAVVVWHRDGTEIMNSSRSAQDGNFCLGVWKRTGERTFLLNHIPWQGNVYDPTAPANAIGNPQEGVQIIENITLSPSGNSYSGTFTLHAYDTSGNVYSWFTGVLSAKRITPDTPFTSLF